MTSTSAIGQLFDALAAGYDQSGVAFFGPVADRLVEVLDPQPGERCLDVGCGRGGVARRVADRVGSQGEVLGIDLSPEMVRLASLEVPTARFQVGDAMAPPGDGWDLVSAGLVLFFLPDPTAALSLWRSRLRRRGRVGVTTVGPQPQALRGIDEVLEPFGPALDPHTLEIMEQCRTDAGVEQLLTAAGYVDVRSTTAPLSTVFADEDQWFAFSRSTRRAWNAIPEDQLADVRARCEAQLESARRPDGAFEVVQDVRVTTGRRPL
jgi:ubiquinone/menaquinone biosynthesis C-methylase UbiE